MKKGRKKVYLLKFIKQVAQNHYEIYHKSAWNAFTNWATEIFEI